MTDQDPFAAPSPDQPPVPPPSQPPAPSPESGAPSYPAAMPPPSYPAAMPPPSYGAGYPAAPPPTGAAAYPAPGMGPIGETRGTGICILLFIVTLGFYGWYWFFKTHDEMKRHSGVGLGGGVALVLTIFVGIVMPYLTSGEVGELYQRRGWARPVSAATGLWNFPGALILVGPIIWFVKTNNALNAYWRALGAS